MPHYSPHDRDAISFRSTCVRSLLYILLIGGITQGVYLEALYLSEVRFSEYGFTELLEIALLVTTAALLTYVRQAMKALPNVTLLLLAFVISSLIREQDHFLDYYVFDGAWQTLVALVLVPSLALVAVRRKRFLDEFAQYSNTFSFGVFAAGFLVTYVFSRLYGRSEMWMAILGEHYQRTFKDAAEEITELLGYTLILIAMIELLLMVRRSRTPT